MRTLLSFISFLFYIHCCLIRCVMLTVYHTLQYNFHFNQHAPKTICTSFTYFILRHSSKYLFFAVAAAVAPHAWKSFRKKKKYCKKVLHFFIIFFYCYYHYNTRFLHFRIQVTRLPLSLSCVCFTVHPHHYHLSSCILIL